MDRIRPANRHEHDIVTLAHRGHKYHVEFARYADGRASEVMCYAPKQDSDEGKRIADYCITLSILLQYGGNLSALNDSLRKKANGQPASLYGKIVKLVKDETDDQ